MKTRTRLSPALPLLSLFLAAALLRADGTWIDSFPTTATTVVGSNTFILTQDLILTDTTTAARMAWSGKSPAVTVDIHSDNPNVYRTINVNRPADSLGRFMELDSTLGLTHNIDHIIITGGVVTGANDGGALSIRGPGTTPTTTGTTRINGSFILDTNSSGRNGGGICVFWGDLILGGTVQFLNNKAVSTGGAISMNGNTNYGGNITFEADAVFTSNTTTTSTGGGLFLRRPETTALFMATATFTNNYAQTQGGAIYTGALVMQRGATFTGNRALTQGGAVYLQSTSTIAGPATFTSNTAGTNGGAIYLTSTGVIGNTLALDASLGNITFNNNWQNAATTAARNSISIYTTTTFTTAPTLNLNTGAGANAHAILFLDPVATTSAAYLNVIQTGDGVTLFDTLATAITATTTINSGAFRLTRGATYGVSTTAGAFTLAGGAAPATLSGNGTLQAATLTLAPGSRLEAIGGGTLTLNAATRNYSPGLQLAGNGTIDAGAPITAALIDIGTINLDNPNTLTTTNTAQTLTLAATTPVTLAAGGTIAIDMFGGTTSDRLIANTLALTPGSANINLTGASGTYTILTTLNTTFAATDFKILVNGLTPTARYAATPTAANIGAGTQLTVDYSNKNLNMTWTGAAPGGVWKNSVTTDANWTDGAATTPENFFVNGDSVTFNDTAANKTVTIDATGVIVASMTVNNTAGGAANDYTIAGPGGITTSATTTIGTLVTPTGKLVKTGAGALNFTNTGTNTFIAGIEISAGTLGFTTTAQLGDGAGGGNGIHFTGNATLRANANNLTLANKLIIDANRTATLDTGANTLTFGGTTSVSSSSTLAKTGAGVLKLTTDNSANTGHTAIQQGTLSVETPAGKLGGIIDISPNAILAGNTTITGTVNAAPAAIIAPGAALSTSAVKLTINTLNLNSSILRFNLFGDGSNDTIAITGALNLAGGAGANTIDVSQFQSGTYNLGNLAALAGTQVTIAGFTQSPNARQKAGVIAATDGSGSLLLQTLADMSRILTWTNAAATGTWNPLDTNWTDNAATPVTLYANGDRVIFNTLAGGAIASTTVAIAGSGVTVSDMQVQGSTNYTFTGAGITADPASVITGTIFPPATAQGKLLKTGSGTLAFQNAPNNFLGGIELNAGALTFTDAAQLGTAPISITGNALLAIVPDPASPIQNPQSQIQNPITVAPSVTGTLDTGATALTLTGALGGSGTLAKIGATALTLTGTSPAANAATLTLAIQQGPLLLNNAAFSGTIDLAANTLLTATGADTLGAIRATAASTLQLTNATLAATTLQLAATSTLASTGNSTLTAATTLNGPVAASIATGATLTLAGSANGAGGFLKTGAGELALAGPAALGNTGPTQIDQGTLRFTGATGTDAIPVTQTITLNGGTLALNYGATPVNEPTAANWTGLRITQGANAAASAITGLNDTITVTDTAIAYSLRDGLHVALNPGANATTVLTGTANNFTGLVRVDSGALLVSSSAQLGSLAGATTKVALNGGALRITGTGFTTTRALELRADGAVTTDAGVATTWGGINVTPVTTGTTTVTPQYTLTKLGTGTLTLAGLSAAAALNVNEGRYVTNRNIGAGTGLVTVASGATIEYTTTSNATISNNFAGAGTLAISSGSNVFTGSSIAISHILITGTNTSITAGSAAATQTTPFGAQGGTLTIDAARLNLANPATTLPNVTLANNAMLAFASTGTAGNLFKHATLESLTGGGRLLLNVNLGKGRGDLLTILTPPTGDYTLTINNTGDLPAKFTAPFAIIDAPPAGAGSAATFTVPGGKIEAGMFSYTVTTDTKAGGSANGGINVIITGTGALSAAGSAINALAGALPLSWLTELETVSQRMGELRMETRARRAGISAWARAYGQQLQFGAKAAGANFDERQLVADGGVDYKIGGTDYNVYLGGFFGYGQTQRTFTTPGDASGESKHGGAYATLSAKNGWYVDGVLKVNGFTDKFRAISPTGETMDGAYNTFAVGGSLELGKRIPINNGWYAELQAQAAYAIIANHNYTTSTGIDVAMEMATTAQARAGFSLGRLFDLGAGRFFQVSAKVNGASQWTTGGELTTVSAGGQRQRFTPKIEGRRVEGGVSLAWQPAESWQFYFDYEAAQAEYYFKPWGVSLGARHNW